MQKITDKARTDGERRTALFGQMVVAADTGKLDQALAEVEKQYALGQKTNDIPAMAGDLQLKGNILLEMGRFDDARRPTRRRFAKITGDANLSQDSKTTPRCFITTISRASRSGRRILRLRKQKLKLSATRR